MESFNSRGDSINISPRSTSTCKECKRHTLLHCCANIAHDTLCASGSLTENRKTEKTRGQMCLNCNSRTDTSCVEFSSRPRWNLINEKSTTAQSLVIQNDQTGILHTNQKEEIFKVERHQFSQHQYSTSTDSEQNLTN